MLKNLVLKNRSYRRFDSSHPLEAKTLIDLIELARNCPSAANLQSLRYLPVWDRKQLDLVFPHLRWAGYLRYWDGPALAERPTGYIIILCPSETTKFHHTDAGIVAQTMLLGAVEKGLGGCMIASADRDNSVSRLN
jgi:nitroreductase